MRKFLWIALAAAVLLGAAVSPFACGWLDGLERVAADSGFLPRGGGKPPLPSPIPDYAFPGISSERWATAAAGTAGTLVTFALAFGLAAALRKRRKP